MNKLEIKNIDFSYGKHNIFDNLTMDIHSGINVILGPNGSGKTTLFKMLAAITKPKKGTIHLNRISYDNSDIRNYLSYVPQNFDIFPNIKVKDFLYYIGNIKTGKKKTELKEEISRAVEQTDIGDFTNEKMKNLSEGMRRRVGIAQALIGDPKLIIADEPTAGLDPEQRAKFNLLINSLSKDIIILISTHIIEDIQFFSDKIFVLSNGKVKFNGSYKEFIHSLDDKVFEMIFNLNEYSETYERDKGIIVLSKIIEKDKVRLHFTLNGKNAPMTEAKKVENPTLAEIWSYYE